jgi:uncharacterized protein
METIVIAGGTGLVGKPLIHLLKSNGHTVRCLSRTETQTEKGIFHWNPIEMVLDERALEGMTVLINLSGAGIAEKRWSKQRVQELYDSRIKSTECLWSFCKDHPNLKHYVSASGAVCYGFDDNLRVYDETDSFGTDLLSDITRKWEEAATVFSQKCTISIIRIGVVLAKDGGALKEIAAPIKKGFGTVLGNGKQSIPWIELHDLVRIFTFVIEQQLSGVYIASAGNTTNGELTKIVAQTLNKHLWLPAVPAFMLKMVLGQMATVVIDGLKTTNQKILSTGFIFESSDLREAIKKIYL